MTRIRLPDSETEFRNYLIRKLDAYFSEFIPRDTFKICRIETGYTATGIPDLLAIVLMQEFWIELKFNNFNLRASQKEFALLAYKNKLKGGILVLCKDRFYFTFYNKFRDLDSFIHFKKRALIDLEGYFPTLILTLAEHLFD